MSFSPTFTPGISEQILQELLSRIEALEAALGTNVKIRTGSATAKWPIKANNSEEITVVTGLTTVSFFTMQIESFNSVTFNLTVLGATCKGTFRVNQEEVPALSERPALWLAIGT
jgi:hypothetical protein